MACPRENSNIYVGKVVVERRQVEQNMLFFVKLNPELSSYLSAEACTAPQMIPDRKNDPQTGNYPQIGPQMIPDVDRK